MAEPQLQIKHSVCTMDCPDTCSLDVEVTDGKITAIRASDLNPTTSGFICSKVRSFANRVYSPDRILYPMKRVGSKGSRNFERISWDQALQEIANRYHAIIQQFGGEAILPYSYGGSNGILGQDTSDKAFFAKLGASRLERTVCSAPTTAAALGMYGKMPGVAFEDYPKAKLIIIWGANPKASNIHLVPFLKNAKANGARIVVVDPRLNFSRREIDLHLPVYPGMDLPVALALIHYWDTHNLLDKTFLDQHTVDKEILMEKASAYNFDKAASISGVKAEDLEKLAIWYAEANPALIRLGWGMERNKNGGQAAAAILAMPALLGKFGVRGGGYTLSNSSAAKLNDSKLVDSVAWGSRSINMNQLGNVLLEEKNPPVKALFVYNCNPAATVPNQNAVLKGLEREDLFTVVFEQVMTDTALYADIILPAVTFLEQEEIKKAYGTYALQYLGPVIDRCGEAKSNEEVFAMLGRSMGWNDEAFQITTEGYMKRVVDALGGFGRKITLDELRENKILFYDFPGKYPVQFQDVFPWTQDGKIHLAPDALGKHPYELQKNGSNGNYSFALISPSISKLISSSMGEYNFPELYVAINSADAKSRQLKHGNSVRVFNEYGEVHCKLRIDDSIRSGVAMMPKGAWRKSSLNGLTATALAPDTLGTAGGACFNDARVEITKLI
jgi:anaerobic selenocysteine-containing dehydrogenase